MTVSTSYGPVDGYLFNIGAATSEIRGGMCLLLTKDPDPAKNEHIENFRDGDILEIFADEARKITLLKGVYVSNGNTETAGIVSEKLSAFLSWEDVLINFANANLPARVTHTQRPANS